MLKGPGVCPGFFMSGDLSSVFPQNSDDAALDLDRRSGDDDRLHGGVRGLETDVVALAEQLQDEGAKSFTNSWNDLIHVIEKKL